MISLSFSSSNIIPFTVELLVALLPVYISSFLGSFKARALQVVVATILQHKG
jgi:hypothetical protein